MLNPLITLTTDFGSVDHFTGTMKGVIYNIAPRVRIVDISHEIQPFEVTDAAFVIAQAYSYFPKKTIHVVVIDPGVGSARRPLLAEMAGQHFIAPDNGVLSMICAREKAKVRHITAERYFLSPLSRTFHGRDIFAPVAAHLAAGVKPAQFGKQVDDYLRLNLVKASRTGKRNWTGVVLKVDHFGNLITNLRIDEFQAVRTRPFELNIGLEKLTRLALTFSEGNPGELFVIVGSSGYLEVAANQDSAARRLRCGAGSPVELTLY
ncbi:MAG: SAM-dependent chlorinase/fluorinase [Acidobacteriaceae bacterium]|nr:SAM-dependent chlorinase/fluorinase [Acidobacteriaceae bacterium]